MRVLFGVASTGYKDNEETYSIIKDAIKDCGHTPYFEGQHETMVESYGDQSTPDSQDWEIMCQREIAAAQSCDAAIFDVTDKATFGVGYMAAICLDRNVPTLFLLQEDSMRGSFISGLRRANLVRRLYNTDDVTRIVGEFLEGRE